MSVFRQKVVGDSFLEGLDLQGCDIYRLSTAGVLQPDGSPLILKEVRNCRPLDAYICKFRGVEAAPIWHGATGMSRLSSSGVSPRKDVPVRYDILAIIELIEEASCAAEFILTDKEIEPCCAGRKESAGGCHGGDCEC